MTIAEGAGSEKRKRESNSTLTTPPPGQIQRVMSTTDSPEKSKEGKKGGRPIWKVEGMQAGRSGVNEQGVAPMEIASPNPELQQAQPTTTGVTPLEEKGLDTVSISLTVI